MRRIQCSIKTMLILIAVGSLTALFTYSYLLPQEANWKPFNLSEIRKKLKERQKLILLVEDTSEIVWTGPPTKGFVDTEKLRSFAFDNGYMLYYLDLSANKSSEKEILKDLHDAPTEQIPFALVLHEGQTSLECVEVSFDEDIIKFIADSTPPERNSRND